MKWRLALQRLLIGKLWKSMRTHIALATVPGCGGVALLGDSITHLGKWDLLFPDVATRNLGIAGERSEHLLQRLDSLIAMNPQKVFVLIGTNDLNYGFGVDEIAANVDTLLARLRAALPDAPVYLQGVMPRKRKFAARILRLNARYRELAQVRGATYVDLFPVFDDGTGQIRADYSEDQLHLNGAGYRAWRELLAPLMKP